MSIKVTFEFETADAAIAFLEGADASPESADKMTAKTRGRPKKDAAASPAALAAPTAAVVSVAPAATHAVVGPGAVPFKDVADAVTKLADIDTPGAKQVLATFGVTLASQLKPEQYGAVVKAFTKAMAPAPTSLI